MLSRRRFLSVLGGSLAAGLLPRHLVARPSGPPKTVAILGAGIGGVSLARELTQLAPGTRVLLIERNRFFTAGPRILSYLVNEPGSASPFWQYDQIRDLPNIEFISANCDGIDVAKQQLISDSGPIHYDYLVLATGASFDYASIAGFDLHSNTVGNPLDRSRARDLHKDIANFAGGNIVIGVPDSALICPPSPYEFALLLADLIKKRHLDAQITLIDAGSQPQPIVLANDFLTHFEQHSDVIEYVWEGGQTSALDAASGQLQTSLGETYDFDLACVIPKITVPPVIRQLNLNAAPDPFVQVNPISFRAVKAENIYAIGDVARVPFGKSAFAAQVSGNLCARAIATEIAGLPEPTSANLHVGCYPHVGGQQAMRMDVSFQISELNGQIKLESHPTTSHASASNFAYRTAWEHALHSDLFM